MANEIKYKNLLNSFIDYSRAYSLDVKNSLSKIFLTQSMGLTEEFMFDRIFTNGTIGSVSGQLVGVPHFIIDDIMSKYLTLKNNISSGATTIQTEFNTLSPNNKERDYVRTTLLGILDTQLTNITNSIISTTNSFRQQQVNLINSADKLNLVTINSYDGEFLNSVGGLVKAYQLTATTLTRLTNNYNTRATQLNSFISKFVTPTFSKNYPGGNEYLFFISRLCTNESMAFSFTGGNKTQLVEVLKYRNGDLYDKLLKVDETGVNGIKYQTKRRFKLLLESIITPWISYDIGLSNPRFDDTLYKGYDILDKNLKKFNNSYDVGYTINTGTTAQNLVRNELKSRNVGSQTKTFNHKMIGQLYIS